MIFIKLESIKSIIYSCIKNVLISESISFVNKLKIRSKVRKFINKHKDFCNVSEDDIIRILSVIQVFNYDFKNHHIVDILNETFRFENQVDRKTIVAFYKLIEEIYKDLSINQLKKIEFNYRIEIINLLKYDFMRMIDTNIKKYEFPIIEGMKYGELDYREVKTFFGRDDEIDKLISFCNDGNNPPNFKWWIIAAEGGIGKSKLVYELKKREYDKRLKNWEIIFYDVNDFHANVNNLYYHKDLLIIIDYFSNNFSQTLKLLKKAMSPMLPYNIRVLLIERGNLSHVLDEYVELNSHRYLDKPLGLSILGTRSLNTIAESFYDELNKKNKNMNHKESVIELAMTELKKDPLKRPLTLLVLIYYYSEYDSGSLKEAFSNYINKFIEGIENTFGDRTLTNYAKEIIFLATLLGEYKIDFGNSDYTQEKLKNKILERAAFENSKIYDIIKCFNGYYDKETNVAYFCKFEPDIFGEAYVMIFNKELVKGKKETLFKYVCKHEEQLKTFLNRIIDDILFVNLYQDFNDIVSFFSSLANFTSYNVSDSIIIDFFKKQNTVEDDKKGLLQRIYSLALCNEMLISCYNNIKNEKKTDDIIIKEDKYKTHIDLFIKLVEYYEKMKNNYLAKNSNLTIKYTLDILKSIDKQSKLYFRKSLENLKYIKGE